MSLYEANQRLQAEVADLKAAMDHLNGLVVLVVLLLLCLGALLLRVLP